MANVIINEAHLEDIADAIRVKNGSEDSYKPREMAAAIAAIEIGTGGGSEDCNGLHVPEEALVITGNCFYMFYGGKFDWFIEKCGDKITTEDITEGTRMFYQCGISEIPFDINAKEGTTISLDSFFGACEYLTKLPYVKGKPREMGSIFSSCRRLKEIPDDWADYIDWSHVHSNIVSMPSIFSQCNSLRRIPDKLMSNLWGVQTAVYQMAYQSLFSGCYVLDEIRDVPMHQADITSNALGGTFASCLRAKDITFATQEDGTPYEANWKSQTIDMTSVGFGSKVFFTMYNSGITEDKVIDDDASYQALKNDPDWCTSIFYYSRYNHDSAVNTINSLPDTSAYLATAGGTNTIKFKGDAGSKTDGGAINTLTEEEIAVATAKGWTVTFA